jgi:hypothetical protein
MIEANRKLNALRAAARFEALTYSIMTLITAFLSLVYVVVRAIGLHIPLGG